MSDTFTQLNVQVVFAVKYRDHLIHENYRDELEKYICGISNNKKCKPLAIYCNPDHLHFLFELNPVVSISDLVRDIKSCSTKWMNEQKLKNNVFAWQNGFGAFTYSRSEVYNVISYILNQSEHHSTKSFKEEYLEMLEKFQVEFKNEYLFDWIEY